MPTISPADLLLYGVKPPAGTTPYVKLGGNGQITAAVYAPGHARRGQRRREHRACLRFGRRRNRGMKGVTNLHYDEALGPAG